MPIAKNEAVADKPVDAIPVTAPVSRKLDIGVEKKNYGRDFDAEARGKVACSAFNAALSSPGLAMFTYANRAEYLAAVKEAADVAVAYTWEKQKGA